ncbi:MAG: PilT/PilU family type 4a pilus ATPase [Candidatus Nitronauta litoralis]|uniref:PilT/PilU family type 4a pilus ATPase n=1 Tax=Candidatus Nitronauta litoralis TaxID=2705533 RepID=A0A7T0G238_9BACT|nr:MAG: PilT/PilU family type 4a pilus ATPase [Candidatus Nitronauta litoralis]
MKDKESFDKLLAVCVKHGASDLHLSCGRAPVYRVHGELKLLDIAKVDQDAMEKVALSLMTQGQQNEFQTHQSIDLGYSSPEGERFRVNCYRQLGQVALAVRHIDQDMCDVEQLSLPPQLKKLAHLPSGLVLVTGATGSGKSTTLAALIHEINVNRNCHVLTIEDPVEFIHEGKESLIHHRELFTDVPDFPSAVRSALREDPDVIMVGEMRDLETMRAALTAAETGHLVFSTLHTSDAVGTVERFVGSFPGDEQSVARHRIAMSLRAVVSQHLMPTLNGGGRVPAVEILIVTLAVANLIDAAKTRQIYSAMESGSGEGMQTRDQSLAKLVAGRRISREQARSFCNDPVAFDKLLQISVLRGA